MVYKPAFADGKLGITVNVFNVTNEQAATYLNARSELSPGSAHPLFGAPMFYQEPRSTRLTVSYDW